MTNSTDYRLYLEEKFIGLGKLVNAQFETVHERLDGIEKQTIKTNSRVNKLEDGEAELKELISTHAGSCPAMGNIDKINENLQEYNFFKKYPKLAILIVSVAVIMVGMSAYQIAQKTIAVKQAVETASEVLESNEKLFDEYKKLIQSVDSLSNK